MLVPNAMHKSSKPQQMHNLNKCNNFVYIQTYQAHCQRNKCPKYKKRERQTKPTKQHKLSHRDGLFFFFFLFRLYSLVSLVLFLFYSFTLVNACAVQNTCIAASIGRESWSNQHYLTHSLDSLEPWLSRKIASGNFHIVKLPCSYFDWCPPHSHIKCASIVWKNFCFC